MMHTPIISGPGHAPSAGAGLRAARPILLALALFLLAPAPGNASTPGSENLQKAMAALREVGPEGRGNAQAAAAWPIVASAGADSLPELLAAMDGANELAINWLRAAIDTIIERETRNGAALPLVALGEFLLNTRHHPRARHLAYQYLAAAKPAAAEALLPGLLNDPSTDLRREAVQRLIAQADLLASDPDPSGATLLYRQALSFAREVDQIQRLTEALKTRKQEVDLPRHFGFLMHWKAIGPFDNTKGAGFEAAFPPEKAIQLDATYPGKNGPVAWTNWSTTHPYGMVDFNPLYGAVKEVTAYAFTEFTALQSQPAELRLGCKNGWKLWFNGQFLFGRDEYHRGAEIDQYRFPIQLKAGKNALLVKVCQNEQMEDWTREWEFQLRVCDATGTAILSADRPPSVLASSKSP